MSVGLQDTGAVIKGDALRSVLGLLLCVALLEAALWAPPIPRIFCLVTVLVCVVRQLRRLTGGVLDAGFSLKRILNGSWLLAPTLLFAGLILTTASYSGSLHRLWGLEHPWTAAAIYTAWAFVQEFMLQCFVLRILGAVLSRVGSLVITASVFSIAHLPNPSLTLVTFIAGIGFSMLYARKKNLVLVAAIHAVLGLTLAVSAPDAWFHELRVGRDFFSAPVSSSMAAPVAIVR
jgi:membrane protease YdiL (CAAX protease family)